MKRTIASFLSFVLIAGAQQVGQNVQPGGNAPATFSTTSQLVVETVTVKDKDGKPVEGLTSKDFTVTEDGKVQAISFAEFQKLPDTPADAVPLAPTTTQATIVNHLARTVIAPEKPGDIQHRDRRLLALYFDMTAMPVPDQIRSLAAAEKFIRTQMTKADLMAILRYAGSTVDVLVDFTDDRDKLLTTVATLTVGEGQGFDENDTSTAADTGAAFGQDDSEFNLLNTDRQLSALQTAAKMLGSLNEKKSLIYFASGLRLNGVDNQAQLHAMVNSAIKSGVQIWPVDARGLMASAPLGDATRGSQGGAGMYSGASAMAMVNNMQRSQDTLWTMAADTGGKAFLDFNDLSMGIVQAQKSTSSYYILGYYTTNQNPDGKFRKVKITLNSDPTAKVEQGRQGYYANKVFSKFTTADKERQLEDALMLGDPVTDLTIAMEIDFFQLNHAEYFVPVTVKIPGRELALAKKGGAERTVIDFLAEIKDEYGNTQQNIRDKADIKLSDATAAELAKKPVVYPTGFTLLPGKYKIKFLARDAETGRIGTYENTFTIPNLDKEKVRLPISSVVLSSQKVDLKDAIYNAIKDKDQRAEKANPLVFEGEKLMPSVTRVFDKDKDMYVYLQAYQQGAETIRPLVSFVTFYKGQTNVYETAPMQSSDNMGNGIKTMPLRFTVPLNKLSPGEYTCQVTVLDPDGQKAAFWSSSVVIVQ